MLAPLSSAYRQLPVTIVALVVSTFAPSSVLAWGNEGHQVIALIAADRLTAVARTEVADLLGGDARPIMQNASTWADYIRLSRPETAP
jgi:nuclease S1